jgi:threonine synthase
MSATLAPPVTANPLRPRPLRCRACGAEHEAAPIAICEQCLGPLDPILDPDRLLPSRAEIARRANSLWRYREWLPFDGEPTLSLDTGGTPLVAAPRLAARLGVAQVWVKNDAVSHPSLSFKDRVVATAINAAEAFGLNAWVFIPEDLEAAKVVGTAVYGARLVRVRGHYDDVNRLCAQVADQFGWGIVNVNLRGYYGEGSKTLAFEIAEQLGWRLPAAVVAPMAGGSLVTKLRKGFEEFRKAGLVSEASPRIYGAQASGCAPIVRLVRENAEQVQPVVPQTIARSIAIGNPADGLFAKRAILESGGWAAAVSDAELVAGIRLLAEETGIFTETAGGVTVAAALALSAEGKFRPDDDLVLCITGNGLKTTDAVAPALPAAPLIAPRLAEVRRLVNEASA